MKPKLKKQIFTFLKISISIGLIWLIFSKLNWSSIREMLREANLFYFFMALVCFVISHFVSVIRFDVFIRKIGIKMSLIANLKLYMVGMFYNLFLPGGVGGDAYKVYLLNETFEKGLKKTGQIVFIERFIGLVAIGFALIVLLLFLDTPFPYALNLLVFAVGTISVWMLMKLLGRWMNIYKKRIYLVFFYSMVAQFFQILSVWFILLSFKTGGDYLAYFFMFLISSVLSIVSFAGLGIREFVFYYGANWFHFNPDISASVGLAFSVMTAFVSFFGIFYIFKSLKFKE